jgi:hypothetical protein
MKGPLWHVAAYVWCVCMAFCVEMQVGLRMKVEIIHACSVVESIEKLS